MRYPRLTRLPLAMEITLLLAIKLSLLFVLARTFFAHPEAKHMQMPVASVEARMLQPPNTATPQATPHTFEVTHGSDR